MSDRSVPWRNAALAVAWALTAGAGGDVLRVDDAGRAGGDGSSWSAAFTFLQDALDAADADGAVTEIWIAAGRYAPDRGKSVMSGSRTASFRLRNGVVLRGGYAGFGAPDPDAQDPDAFVTILTGDLAGDDGPGFVGRAENAFHVVTASGAGETAGLEDVVVEGGNADGSGTNARGGGVYMVAGAPYLSGCRLRDNRAGTGGGLWADGGAVRLFDMQVQGNAATIAGGGLYLRDGAPDVGNLDVRDNAAILGGGAYLEGASAVVGNAVFANNTAAFDGGGLIVEGADGVYVGCRWTGNSAGFDGGGAVFIGSAASIVDGRFVENGAARGGGAYTFGGAPVFSRPRFLTNTATESGGGFAADGGAPHLADGIWQLNTAPLGGGLVLEGTQSTLTNGILAVNTATDGGAVALRADASLIVSGTFVSNAATRSGGGAFIEGGTPLFTDALFVENVASGGFVRNGGAVAVTAGGAPRFENAHFEANEGGFGGAIYSAESTPEFVDGAVVENLAVVGGGMYVTGGGPIVERTAWTGNATADGPTSVGGGIYVRAGELALTDCTFRANAASVGGGGVALEDSTGTVRGGGFIANTADGLGGAFNVDGGALHLDAVRIIGNTAARGGGVHGLLADLFAVNTLFAGNRAVGGNATGGAVDALVGTVHLVNTTVFANASDVSGGGITGFDVQLENCVLWGNSAGEATTEAAQLSAILTVLESSCVQGLTGALGGVGNIGADPDFVDRLGPDGIAGTEDDDLRLAAPSPCIDTGSDAAVPDDVDTDLDGNLRFIGTVDMGAYERPAADCAADLNDDGDVDLSDLLEVLSAWGACPGCAADLDGNGSVGFEDLVLMLSAWGACGV